jgi:hypothetical protein
MPSSPAKTEVVARLSPGAHQTQSRRRLSAKLAVVEQTLQHAATHHHHHCGRAHRSTSRRVASRQTRSRRSSDEKARTPGAAAPASSSSAGTTPAAAASARTVSPMPAAPGRPGSHAGRRSWPPPTPVGSQHVLAMPTPLRRRRPRLCAGDRAHSRPSRPRSGPTRADASNLQQHRAAAPSSTSLRPPAHRAARRPQPAAGRRRPRPKPGRPGTLPGKAPARRETRKCPAATFPGAHTASPAAPPAAAMRGEGGGGARSSGG